jgi:hypothetical protein
MLVEVEVEQTQPLQREQVVQAVVEMALLGLVVLGQSIPEVAVVVAARLLLEPLAALASSSLNTPHHYNPSSHSKALPVG